MTAAVERRDLAPGYSMSRLIKGGWQLAGGHGVVDRATAITDMRRFVDAGITTFDCADIYTGVEDLIGAFLRELRRHRGCESARHVQVHTKYVPDLEALPTLTPADVEHGIDRSLARLGVERLDLVQFHWWDYEVPGFVEAALTLDRLRQAGKIRLIGVTNFDTLRLRALVEAGVPVASIQLQYSLLDRRPAQAMAEFCAAHGIQMLCYGTLAGGFLSASWLDVGEPAEPLENRSLTKYKLIIDECGGWQRFQRLLATLARVGEAHDVGPGTVAVRWVLDQPCVAAAIVGARHGHHLQDTLAVNDLVLNRDEHAALDAVMADAPGPAGEPYALERAKDGRHARIMKYNLNTRAGH